MNLTILKNDNIICVLLINTTKWSLYAKGLVT